MPEYLTPGVYIEEFEIGAKPIEGVSTSTAVFLGEALRGPTYPQLVTSFLEYRRLFGGFFGETKYLPSAVDGFFTNGGRRCFVSRIVDRDGARSATATVGSVQIIAVGEGRWGQNVAFRVKNASTKGFRLQVHYWAAKPENPVDPTPTADELAADPALKDALRKQPRPEHSEDFDDLSTDEASPDHFERRVGRGLSMLIQLKRVGTSATRPPNGPLTFLTGTDTDDGAPVQPKDYEGRLQQVDDIVRRTGLAALAEPAFEEVALMYAPNADAAVVDLLISHCENNKYRFLIVDSPQRQATVAALLPRDGQPLGRATQYAAFYYPWIKVIAGDGGVPKFVPPGGHVAGIYARSDIERGVFKAPANEIVRGALELEFEVTDGGQAILNPRGVNVIRAFPGRGRRVWGARTLSDNTLWKYVSVRRLFIFLEASIFRGTQWVVFEPNNERLWARVKQTITEFLRTQFRAGALLGATEEEAFFVKVDRSTMTDDDINNGRLIVVIGVAPVRPAEFVIFRIAQLTSSATSVEL
jgi:Bacteriophage tail sheath protein